MPPWRARGRGGAEGEGFDRGQELLQLFNLPGRFGVEGAGWGLGFGALGARCGLMVGVLGVVWGLLSKV